MGLVSFIRDSGENIFSETVLKKMESLEISECGLKFLGHVSFIWDSGRNIFFEAVLKLKFLGHVSFIRDSGKNIFVRGRFEIFGNRFEIFSVFFASSF